jgi:hypothetical protein
LAYHLPLDKAIINLPDSGFVQLRTLGSLNLSPKEALMYVLFAPATIAFFLIGYIQLREQFQFTQKQ